MKIIKFIFTSLALIVTFTACDDSNSIDLANAMVAKSIFKLQDTEGKKYIIEKKGDTYNIAEYSNRVIILDFFATWCPPCKATAPHLANLQKKFPEDLLVLGVLLEENKPSQYVKLFQEKFGAHYAISNAPDNYKLAQSVYAAVQAPRSMPIPLIVIFKDGKYINHYTGAMPEEMVESDIKKALGE